MSAVRVKSNRTTENGNDVYHRLKVNVPDHWQVVPLEEALDDIIGGGTPSKANSEYWLGSIPWLTVKDMRTRRPEDAIDHISIDAVGDSATNIIPADTVIIATRIGLGKVVRVPYDAAINQDLKALIAKPEVEKGYLEYWILSIAEYLESIGSGTTVKGIRLEQLRSLPFPLAPLNEQKRIVAEIEKQFSRLDEAAANLKRVKANLKRYKAAVLKAAVEGQLTERWRTQHPDVEPASKLLERILAERRAKWNGRGRYREPAKPDISEPLFLPEKWTWTTVDQLTAMVTSGSRGWGEYYSDTGPLFIRAQDIKTDSLNLQTIARVRIPENTEGTRTAVTKGDILITITGANVTKSALVKKLQEQAFVSQHVALLKPSIALISTYLFTWVITPAHGRKMLERWAYGAGKPGLSLDQVRSLPVALPPLTEQHQIAAEIERRLSVIEELEAAVQTNLTRTDRLRQSILSGAFSGKLFTRENPAAHSSGNNVS